MHQDKVAFLWFCDNWKKKGDYQLHLSPSFHVLVPQTVPTVSVPIYLLLLNLLFIFPLCCPHYFHCLTWSSPHSTIKSCCHHGDFSTLGTRAGCRLRLAPHSFPSWPYYCGKAKAEVSLAPREITPLVPALATELLSCYSSFSYLTDDILCWTSCSGMSVHVLHCIYSIIFTCFPFISYHEVYCLLVFILWPLITSYLSEMEFTCTRSGFCVMNITQNLRQTCQSFVTQN